MASAGTQPLLRKLVLGGVILFLVTLANSIFLNQVGYYGALVLLLASWYRSKQNPFSKTGIEPFILFYMAAEILSTLFSVNQPQAFHNLLKRFLLIPVIYTIAAAAGDFKAARTFFLVYIAAAVAVMLVYLGASYKYVLYNLYQLRESGPSLFQYPITTSELLSFTLLFLLAFLVTYKGSKKEMAVIAVCTLVAAAALLATYKRTGWMGSAAGLVFMLVLARRWLLLAPVAAGILLLIFLESNYSSVTVYRAGNGMLQKTETVLTPGRACWLLPDSTRLLVADFEAGITEIQNGQAQQILPLPSPATYLLPVNDSLLLTYLVDTRFLLLRRKGASLQAVREMLTPGLPAAFALAGNALYVLDKDSGLTAYPDIAAGTAPVRYPGITNGYLIAVDSSRIAMYVTGKGLSIQSLSANLPSAQLFHRAAEGLSFLAFYRGHLIASGSSGTSVISPGLNGGYTEHTSPELRLFYGMDTTGGRAAVFNLAGDIYTLQEQENSILFIRQGTTGVLPRDVRVWDGQYFVASFKKGRLSSFTDPYNPSNFGRLALWRAGLLMLKDHPVFGVGDIDLADLYKKYKRPYDKEIQGHLHNNYFHLLATLGIFGFIAVMLLLGSVLWLHIKLYNGVRGTPFASSYALGAAGGFVAFLVAGLTEWNFGDHEIITMVWFSLGLSIAFYRSVKQGRV